jgi:hypothetical protein
VSCHMPPRRLWNDIDISMADHWIRVFPETRQGAPTKSEGKERESTN